MPEIPRNVRALLSGLQFRSPQPEALLSLSDFEWNDLFSQWGILRLMIPLRQTCPEYLPEWVRSHVDQNIADNTERFARIKRAYTEFARGLNERGGEHIVVKGFAQCPDFCEHPRFRLQSDIDVYCPPESIDDAVDVLCELGYEAVEGPNFSVADHLPTMARKTNWKWRGKCYDPEIPASFELHFTLWNENLTRLRVEGVEEFWQRRVKRSLGDLELPSLSLVDNVGYSALILLRDVLYGPISIHLAYELARLLNAKAHDQEFWRTWEQSHSDSLRKLEVVSFRVASHYFDCRQSDIVKDEIERQSASIGVWLEQCGDHSLEAWFRPNKSGLWLHMSLLESFLDKRTVLAKRLLPIKIPSIKAPQIQATPHAKKGKFSSGSTTKNSKSLRERIHYGSYLVGRVSYHIGSIPATLWRGFRLQWSAIGFGRDFMVFLLASLSFDLGMFIFFFLYNLYLLDHGFKENFLGLLSSAMMLGSVAGTIPAGILISRLGLRKALGAGVVLVSLVSALRSIVLSETSLIILAFLAGFVSIIWAVGLLPTVAQVTTERNRPMGFSVQMFFSIAIGILGAELGSRLPAWLMQLSPAEMTGHRPKEMVLLLGCAITALAIFPISRLHFSSAPIAERKTYPKNPFLIRFLIVLALWSLAIGSFTPFLNVYFARYLEMPLKQIGTVYSLAYIPQLLAILLAPLLFRKFGLVGGIALTQIATAASLFGLAAARESSAATIIYMVYVAFQWMNEPGLFSLLMNQVSTAERTGASAMNFLVMNASQAVAATIAGSWFVRFGYPFVLSATAAVALLAAVLFRVMLGKEKLNIPQSSLPDFNT